MDENKIKDEVSGDTQTPNENELPNLNTDPKPTDEQKAEAASQAGINEDATKPVDPEEDKTHTDPVPSTTDGNESEVKEDNAGNGSSENTPIPSVVKEELEKMFTQSQVNDIVGKTRTEARERAEADTRAKVLQELFGRYGVSNDEELDAIFGKGQAYDVINDEKIQKETLLENTMAENALLKSRISLGRWDDAKAILKSKGLAVTEENLLSELETHPEWRGEEQNSTQTPKEEKPSTIERLGTDKQEVNSAEAEEAKMNRLFGL
jgi:hypothetical protein